MGNETVTVLHEGEGLYEEKRSRFISYVCHVESEEEIREAINGIRRKRYDASHHCYGWVLRNGGKELEKCSDDGEPQKTAGYPILNVIKGLGLTDTLVVVTRYFGGTLLGTGGLVRAYTKAAQEGIKAAVVIRKKEALLYEIRTDYNSLGRLQNYFRDEDLTPSDMIYTDSVSVLIPVPEERSSAFVKKIADLTNGSADCTVQRKILYAGTPDGTVLFDEEERKEEN